MQTCIMRMAIQDEAKWVYVFGALAVKMIHRHNRLRSNAAQGLPFRGKLMVYSICDVAQLKGTHRLNWAGAPLSLKNDFILTKVGLRRRFWSQNIRAVILFRTALGRSDCTGVSAVKWPKHRTLGARVSKLQPLSLFVFIIRGYYCMNEMWRNC